MEPRIQYVTTSDGVRIAYTIRGSGPPLVHDTGYPFNDLRGESNIPSLAAFNARLASATTFIRFDHRGTGMSQRDRLPESPRDLVTDLEAVLDKIDLFPVTLSAWGFGGFLVAEYFLSHPDRVDRLVLMDSALRRPDDDTGKRVITLLKLALDDWELFTETASQVTFGWDQGDEARAMARYLRESSSPEAVAVTEKWLDPEFQVPPLEQLTVPTLVLHHRDAVFPPGEMIAETVSNLPNASLVSLEGTWITSVERAELAADAILDFMGRSGTRGTSLTTPGSLATTFRTILFTDLVGHTEMMSRLGDDAGRNVLREHERITREVLKANGGTEVKTMGDGFMASFGSVTRAVECAVALQKAFEQESMGAGEQLRVRCGLNAGEPIEEDGDLFGATVILASRIAAKAEGGEILVADTVRGLCSGKGFLFSDRGEFVAKGFDEAVRVYEVRWRG